MCEDPNVFIAHFADDNRNTADYSVDEVLARRLKGAKRFFIADVDPQMLDGTALRGGRRPGGQSSDPKEVGECACHVPDI